MSRCHLRPAGGEVGDRGRSPGSLRSECARERQDRAAVFYLLAAVRTCAGSNRHSGGEVDIRPSAVLG